MTSSARDWLRSALLSTFARILPRGESALPSHPHILLVRPDHLGDVLLASAGVAALRSAVPSAHLTLLVGPWSREVAQRSSPVDRVLSCEFPAFTRAPKGAPWGPYLVLAREAWRLRQLRFDMAVILRPDHWWGALLVALSGIPVRLGYATELTAELLTHAEPLPANAHSVELGLQLARRAAEIARAQRDRPIHSPGDLPVGRTASQSGGDVQDIFSDSVATPQPSPMFRVDESDEVAAQELLARHEFGQRPLLVIHPGSGSALKAWLPSRWAAAADALSERLGMDVAVTGGGAELELVQDVAASMRRPVAALAGDLPLGTLAALLQRADLVLGADSGPLHLAAAVGTPTIRLYGPTDPDRFGPWGQQGRHCVVRIQLPCSPCGNLVDPPCGATATPQCMLGISVAQVLSAQRTRRGM